jgi:valine--pyruvate aminotransferase
MKLSAFGQKFAGKSGIVELMDDLGEALHSNPDMLFMGGGNPSRLMDVEVVFQQRLEALMHDPRQRHSLFGIYQSPQGDVEFRQQVASFLKAQYGWDLTAANIAVSNGSQSAFFVIYNMFAGQMPDGTQRTIHLPLSPEYMGYADVGLTEHFFTATRPNIDILPDHIFKYRVDFSEFHPDDSVGALCVSRPTNPSGNVLTDSEMARLDEVARLRDIPLIIDGAYGMPFPGICFVDATPMWNDNIILALSLSKLGLPGVRTGIIIASEEIVDAFTNANTIISLASGNLGPAIAREWFRTGEILELSAKHVTPFYQGRSQQTVQWFREAMGDLPFHIHKPEGAIFLWVWFEGLPISSQELYQRLKARGVLVSPGQGFFIGLEGEDWPHRDECIRVSYAQDEKTVRAGVTLIAEEAKKAYAEG